MIDKYGYSRVSNIDFNIEYIVKEHYYNLIKWVVNLTNCQSYLEIGIYTGECIHNIRDIVKKCVAVDVSDNMSDKEKIEFNLMSSDEFFDQNSDLFDIIFIDGDHNYEQVEKDFENSLKILNTFGIIILHDTDPIDYGMTHIKYCSDSYKIVNYIEKNHLELNIITLPIHETGLSLVMRKKDKRSDDQWEKHWSKK